MAVPVVAQGKPDEVVACEQSLTADYLTGRREVAVPLTRRKAKKGHKVSLKGATGNNLKNVSVDISLGVMTCVTGVSGSGKSTLILDTFYKAAARAIMRAKRCTNAV